MAQKVRIILEDDLDGGPADETIRFGLDGAHYEIDLRPLRFANGLRLTVTRFLTAAAFTRTFRMHTTQL